MPTLGHGIKEVGSEKLTFLFSTSSPVDFGSLVAGDQIIESSVIIDTVFDDAAALLSLGLTSDPGNIFATNRIDPQTVGTYSSDENLLIAGADSIRLQIIPGTSIQGGGRVVIVIRRA